VSEDRRDAAEADEDGGGGDGRDGIAIYETREIGKVTDV
jgi:hypothetical protein